MANIPAAVVDDLPPPPHKGVWVWLRANLFNTPVNTIVTLVLLFALWKFLAPMVGWSVVNAVWTGEAADCRAGTGACWAFIAQRYRLILFGLYPYDEQWRPLLTMILLVALLMVSGYPKFWKPWLGWLWVAGLIASGWLMWGGFGLLPVSDDRWGGLPLTLILSVFGIVLSFPLAVLLALGRRSKLPAIRAWCVAYIELWRGVPLVSVLFMASIMFPLFLPEGLTINKLLRAQIGIILFTAAYVAEGIRGGLQALPAGQYEAADALGLGYWRKTQLIIMPQALRLVIPSLVGQFITTFKDTSFVLIIGLYDLLGSTKAALADPQWRAFYVEAYIFAAIIYFVFTFSMSRYSLFLERKFGIGKR